MKKKVARTIEELPALKGGYVRAVHLTSADSAEKIISSGLSYERQGMLSSAARYWANESEVEYQSDDPRFSGRHIRVVVLDIPQDEARLHNDVKISPGTVPPEYVVGVIHPYHRKERKQK